MASTATLRDHLIDELNDLLNAEEQLIEALPKMAQKATDRQLKTAFTSHLAQTRGHAKRVTQAIQALGEQPDSTTCEAMEGLIEEGEELMSQGEPGPVLDAMLITAAQKVEHYEIATYGTVCTYANVIGERKVSAPLAMNLKEEKAADKKLTSIAEGTINRRAAQAWQQQSASNDEGMMERGARWMGSAVGRMMPRTSAPDKTRARGTSRKRSTKRSRSGGSKSRSRSRRS
jgi:ferritin-like metal-binding protein YciE